MKNYIGFLNDESGSMASLRAAAIRDYNANINAVKSAATKEMQDTIVSMSTFSSIVERKVVNSNPHVLRPITSWRASGGTLLRPRRTRLRARSFPCGEPFGKHGCDRRNLRKYPRHRARLAVDPRPIAGRS